MQADFLKSDHLFCVLGGNRFGHSWHHIIFYYFNLFWRDFSGQSQEPLEIELILYIIEQKVPSSQAIHDTEFMV